MIRYQARHNPALATGFRGNGDASEYQVWDAVDECWHGPAFYDIQGAREFAAEMNTPDGRGPIYTRGA